MLRRVELGKQPTIRKVCNCFSGSGEGWRTVLPTHGQNQREGNQWLLPLLRWEHNTELGNVIHIQIDAVESITNINLHQPNRPEGGVGK